MTRKSAVEKKESIDIELRLVLKNDVICHVNIKGEMVPDDKGSPWKLSGTMQDITQQKQFEIQLQELNENLRKRAIDLQSSNAELERFAYVASHDLQEPLRMVSSFLNLLEKKLDGQLDETTRKYIGFAVDGSERMKKLIQDLLQFSRLGTSKEGYSEVDCNEVIKNIGSIFALSLTESKTQLTVHPLPVVKAVQPQLQQVFQNLIGNAIKYNNKETPHIEVGCYDEEKFWKFFVKDNGIGIDPKFYDKIFIIFQRLHNKSEYSGTGIGLAICKKIVEKHGGKIWVESEADKGSIFYFTILKHTL